MPKKTRFTAFESSMRALVASRDRHALYEKAVQDPAVDLGVLERVLKRAGRPARRLREDFSGTALVSASWVMSSPERSAVAVDNDRAVHAWARENRLPGLAPDARKRLQLVDSDVRKGPRGPFDAVIALNFSYQAFQTRRGLRDYLSNALRSLAPGGFLMLDTFGGWFTQQGVIERRRIGGGVTYVWEQEPFDPITHRVHCFIHFEADGRWLPGAFHYDWRLWTLPELTDLLVEVGFDEPQVLWDVAPRGVTPCYRPRRQAVNERAWLAYVLAQRPQR